MRKWLKLLLLLLFTICICYAEAQPFANEIAAFKKQDSISFPPKQAILFVGSSSFTMWKDVQQYFPGYTIINRGFGGSSLTDVIRYQREIIFPYHAKQIVIYCGENDIAGDSTISGKMVFERFVQLYWALRKNRINAPIVYLSMKPSPSRWNMKERMQNGNELIKKYSLKRKRNITYIDVWQPMLGPDGKPMPDIFLSDSLHMNAKGYAIWQKLIKPYLAK